MSVRLGEFWDGALFSTEQRKSYIRGGPDRSADGCSPKATKLELAAISKESKCTRMVSGGRQRADAGACTDPVLAGLALLAWSTGAEILQAHYVLHAA